MNPAQRKNQNWHRVVLLAALMLASLPGSIAWAGDWSLKDKDGVRYTLAGLKGKWLLVNFWAPWCPSCIQEMPELISLQQKHKDLRVIGVAVMYGTQQEVKDLAKSKGISYPIVLGNEDIASDFGEMKGMPSSFLYSPTGKLVSRYEGPLAINEVESVMVQK